MNEAEELILWRLMQWHETSRQACAEGALRLQDPLTRYAWKKLGEEHEAWVTILLNMLPQDIEQKLIVRGTVKASELTNVARKEQNSSTAEAQAAGTPTLSKL